MSANHRPEKLTVADFMVTKVYRITPEMKLREVAETFVKHGISGSPVVDSMDRVMSVIGEGATLRLAASEGLDATVAHCLGKLPAFDDIVTLHPHSTFTEAYRLFLKHQIHRIPIVDGSAMLKGLISRSMILKVFVESFYGKKITKK